MARYCSGLRVSADRAANRAAHTPAKAAVLDLQRPGLCETLTRRWRKTDSNTKAKAIEAIETVAELTRETAESDPRSPAKSQWTLVEGIAASFILQDSAP